MAFDDPTVLQVVTTVATEEDAIRIATRLVDARLAACVQIDSSVKSVYRWEGRIGCDPEYRLVVKTTGARWDALRQEIDKIHPYELPELIATEINVGNNAYLRWVAEQVQG